MLEVSVSIGREIAALSMFSKICLKSFSLTDIFQLHKYQALVFNNLPTTRKRQ